MAVCILPQQKLNEMTVPGRDLTLDTPNFVFTEDSSKFAFGNLPILKNPLKFSLFSFFSYICNSYIQKRNDN